MTSLTLETNVSFDKLLQSLSQLNEHELDMLAQRTAFERAKARVQNLDSVESDLLSQIEKSQIVPELKAKCAKLVERQQNQTLSQAEQKDLADVIDEMEMVNATRLGYLIELANLREMTLDQLMADLELIPLLIV